MSDGVRPPKDHLYGGQAVPNGVMMRGRAAWALAVRRPDSSVHLESHDIPSRGRSLLRSVPGLRGLSALGQALSIGMRALAIASTVSAGNAEKERVTPRQMALSASIAGVVFLALFVVGPALLFRWVHRHLDPAGLVNALEGVFRIALFVGYLAFIRRSTDIRRVFQYHGAEHKTIAAYEDAADLSPQSVDRYSTLHVRCGTNFLVIVLLLTIPVFAFFGNPPLGWALLWRVAAIPLIAGLAFEGLRLGARFRGSPVMRVLMAPGLLLQRITTQPPTHDQIEVAIASFREVLRREQTEAATDAAP